MSDLSEDDELGESEEHEPWCRSDCDGTVTVDGGFVTVACGCRCHDEDTAFIFD